MIVSTDEGVFTSFDDGRSWRPRDAAGGARLAWSAAGPLYAADRTGQVSVSTNGGQSWSPRGKIGTTPNALTAAGENLFASVANGEVWFSGDGGKTWRRYAKLR